MSKLNLVRVCLFGCFVLSIAVSGIASDQPVVDQAESEALSAAQSWLELVDASQYAESWQNAASFFTKAVTKEKWNESMISFRQPLGKIVKRTLKSKQYTRTLPGAPEGEYVVVQFNTEFEHKKAAVETVTPMKEKDGSWKVSGYYIK